MANLITIARLLALYVVIYLMYTGGPRMITACIIALLVIFAGISAFEGLHGVGNSGVFLSILAFLDILIMDFSDGLLGLFKDERRHVVGVGIVGGGHGQLLERLGGLVADALLA